MNLYDDNPVLEELRETRRRLSEACHHDMEEYMRMLKGVSERHPGIYVSEPLPPRNQTPALPAIDNSTADEAAKNHSQPLAKAG
jgi:hypothetical protein